MDRGGADREGSRSGGAGVSAFLSAGLYGLRQGVAAHAEDQMALFRLGPVVLRWVVGLSFLGMAAWMLVPDAIDADARHPALCGRCVSNLFGSGEARQYA